MEREQKSLTFVNTRKSPQFPNVGLIMDVTDLVVHTVITDKYARQTITVTRIQELLGTMFGPLEWNVERDVALRTTIIYGSRDLMNRSPEIRRLVGEELLI